MRTRIFLLYAFLIAAHVGAWAWALIAFHGYPLLLGTALLGLVIIGVFALSWLGPIAIYRFNRYDEIDVNPETLV